MGWWLEYSSRARKGIISAGRDIAFRADKKSVAKWKYWYIWFV